LIYSEVICYNGDTVEKRVELHKGVIKMKARVERGWIRVAETGGIEMYEVVVRVDIKKGKFIESVHRRREDAEARVRELLRIDITVAVSTLTPTI